MNPAASILLAKCPGAPGLGALSTLVAQWPIAIEIMMLGILATTSFSFAEDRVPKELSDQDKLHSKLIKVVDSWIAKRAPLAAKDPERPVYHIRTPANWFNDPHGAIFYEGRYHLFMQHAIFQDAEGMEKYYDDIMPDEGSMTGISMTKGWAHIVSEDLVHWEHWPTALVPTPGTYDRYGVWSGCLVIDDDGIPTIIYSGFPLSPVCMAQSFDGLRTWVKYKGNPLMLGEDPNPPHTFYMHQDVTAGWRDPWVWKEADTWLMLIGTRIDGKGESGATALLYESKNLIDWEYLHPLCFGYGRKGATWECPNFFPLGDGHVLEVSIGGAWSNRYTMYASGTYEDRSFTPRQWQILDWGMNHFLAPTTMLDQKGRRILWGYVSVGGARGYPWESVLSLPRVLTLRSDGRLNMEPLPELKILRGKHHHFDPQVLDPDTPNILDEIKGDTLEIIAEFEPVNATSFGIDLRRSGDGSDFTTVKLDVQHHTLINGDRQAAFQLLPSEDTLRLHIFLDKAVVEVYGNYRECVTTWHYASNADDANGLKMFVQGGSVKLRSLDVWEMKTIWE